MPTGAVKKASKKYGVSIDTAENEWSAAKAIGKKEYGESNKKLWGTVMNIFKNKMKAHHGRKRKKKNEKIFISYEEFLNEQIDNIESEGNEYFIEYGYIDGDINYEVETFDNLEDAISYAHDQAVDFDAEFDEDLDLHWHAEPYKPEDHDEYLIKD
jgi:hypothetical protein